MTTPTTGIVRRDADNGPEEVSMMATSPTFITARGTPTDEQFEIIRKNFVDPRADVKPEDYFSFRMIASGDGLDSYYTRQDLETSFGNFVRDLTHGQSLLGSHQMATFSYGSSYGAEIIPADETRSEYEGTFYPQWDMPDLRTKHWLVGDYFMTRGIELNQHKTNDLIRALETGAVRKASVSFMVGQYVCGLDGQDLIGTQFGPMPGGDVCKHFPGLAYEGSVAWALMKHNTLVETSLVYKNASPSSMLLRKAEALSEAGAITAREIQQLESRFEIRLPRHNQTLWNGFQFDRSVTTNSGASDASVTVLQEEDDMAKPRGSGDEATRLAREALVGDPEPETDDTAEADAPAEPVADAPAEETPETPAADEATDAPADADAEPVSEAAEPDVEASAEPDPEPTPDPEPPVEAEANREPDPVPAPDPEPEPAPAEAEADAPAEAPAEEEAEDPKSESADANVVSAFVNAANKLASELVRNPEAFDSGSLADAAMAERSIDLALIDAGCETTVGSHVARTFETRSKAMSDALGERLTVEAIRSLQSSATLGETLYEELVKDAVAARVTAQGEAFTGRDKYRDLLRSARDVPFIKEEIASWKEAKKDRFVPGRQVTPRQPVDTKSTKEDRKGLPEAPAAPVSTARAQGTSSLIPTRNKK